VILERRDGQVVLIVEDDGSGFDTSSTDLLIPVMRQLGLTGMRERAALVGGTLEVESEPGKGTTVFMRVPVDPEAG